MEYKYYLLNINGRNVSNELYDLDLIKFDGNVYDVYYYDEWVDIKLKEEDILKLKEISEEEVCSKLKYHDYENEVLEYDNYHTDSRGWRDKNGNEHSYYQYQDYLSIDGISLEHANDYNKMLEIMENFEGTKYYIYRERIYKFSKNSCYMLDGNNGWTDEVNFEIYTNFLGEEYYNDLIEITEEEVTGIIHGEKYYYSNTSKKICKLSDCYYLYDKDKHEWVCDKDNYIYDDSIEEISLEEVIEKIYETYC